MTYDVFHFRPDFSQPPEQRLATVAETLAVTAAPMLVTWPDRRPEHLLSFRLSFEQRRDTNELLAFFSRMGGRHRPFLVPTWTPEFAILGSPAAGAESIEIDLADFELLTTYDDERGRFIWIADPDAGLQVVRVLATVGDETAVLTLEQPLAFAPSPQALAGFAWLVRFDQDDIELATRSPEVTSTTVAFRTIHHQTDKTEAYEDLETYDAVYATLPMESAEQATGNKPWLDQMISDAFGPDNLRTTQDGQYQQSWVAWLSDTGVRIARGNRGDITRPANTTGAACGLFATRPDTRHISLTFDQASREAIAYQKDARTIAIRRWVSGVMREDTWTGQSPQAFLNGTLDPAEKTDGNSDIVVLYFKPGDGLIYARAQRDNFATEYRFSPLVSEANEFLWLETDLEARRARLVVVDSHWRLVTYESEQYPEPPIVPPPPFVYGWPAPDAAETSIAFLDGLYELVTAPMPELADSAIAGLELDGEYQFAFAPPPDEQEAAEGSVEIEGLYELTIIGAPELAEAARGEISAAGSYVKTIEEADIDSEQAQASIIITGEMIQEDPGPGDYAILNPSDKASVLTLASNNQLTVNWAGTTGGIYYLVRATQGKSSGKWYWETSLNGQGTGTDARYVTAALILAGYALTSPNTSTYPGLSSDSVGGPFFRSDVRTYKNAVGSTALGSMFTSGIVRHALDMDAGTYQQALNAGSFVTVATGLSGTYFPALVARRGTSGSTSGDTGASANFGASAFSYSVPSGYNAGVFDF
jgi:hypothetical protein